MFTLRSFSLVISLFAAGIPLAADRVAAQRPATQIRLEGDPLPLEAKHPRTEGDLDRNHAAAILATGVMLLRKDDSAEALRKLQRAARYTNYARHDVRRVIALADGLDRTREAESYAYLLSQREITNSNSILLAMLYHHRHRETPKATALYEKALTAEVDSRKTIGWLHLSIIAGRMYIMSDQPKRAAAALDAVDLALADPQQFNLTARQADLLRGDQEEYYEDLARARLAAGDLQGARRAFAKLESAAPNEARALVVEAEVLLAENKTDAALRELSRYFDKNFSSRRGRPYEMLGEIFRASDRKDVFLPKLRQLAADDVENAALGVFLATQLEQQGEPKAAADLMQRHLDADPHREAFDLLIRCYQHESQPDKILDTLARALTTSGNFLLTDEVLEALAKDGELVAKVAKAASAARDQDARAFSYTERLAMAHLAAEAKQFDTAAKFYELAIRFDRTKAGELMLDWGEDLYFAKQMDPAREVFTRALAAEDTLEYHVAYHDYLSAIAIQQDRLDDAIDYARKAVELDPESAESASRLGSVLQQAEHNEQAIAVYLGLVAKHETNYVDKYVRDLLRDARLSLSLLYAEAGNHRDADEMLERVLDEFPNDVHALNNLAYAWAERDVHLRRALAMGRVAVAAEPESEAYRDTVGWSLYKLQRYPEAIKELELATKTEPPDPVGLDHLGDAHLAAGDSDAAREVWTRAVAAFDPDVDQDKIEVVQKKIEKSKH